VTNRIAVWNGSDVQRYVVTAGTPTVVFLGHDIKSRGSRTFGEASCAIPQHGVEFRFGNSESVRCQSTWSAGDWWAWCSSDMVGGVVMTSRWTPVGRVRSGNSERECCRLQYRHWWL
jgi:hypothetical protein